MSYMANTSNEYWDAGFCLSVDVRLLLRLLPARVDDFVERGDRQR